MIFMNNKTKHSLINIGTGKDTTIEKYAYEIMKILNYKASIKFDKTKPNGTFRKTLDVSLAKSYGWKSKTSLKNGIIKTYEDFILNFN